MLHGFPELWYSYRHQLPALADAGYHAVAPDVRGYGQSDAPQPIEAYSMKEHLARRARHPRRARRAETAVVVGHDWGAPMAWNCAVLYPERYRAVVGLSVPFLAALARAADAALQAVFKDNFFYMLYFQEPGVAEKELEADPRTIAADVPVRASGDAVPARLPRQEEGRPVPHRHGQPGEAAGLAHRSRRRLLRERVPAHRLPRRAQPLPQHGPRLGASCRSSPARRSRSPRSSSAGRRTACSRSPAWTP